MSGWEPRQGEPFVARVSITSLLERYHGIDGEALEREKAAMLDEVRRISA